MNNRRTLESRRPGWPARAHDRSSGRRTFTGVRCPSTPFGVHPPGCGSGRSGTPHDAATRARTPSNRPREQPAGELDIEQVGPRVCPAGTALLRERGTQGRRRRASARGWLGRVFQGEAKAMRGVPPPLLRAGQAERRHPRRPARPRERTGEGHGGQRERPTTRAPLGARHGPQAGTGRTSLKASQLPKAAMARTPRGVPT